MPDSALTSRPIMAFLMDPFERLAPVGDSTLALAEAAAAKWRLFSFEPGALRVNEQGRAEATGRFFTAANRPDAIAASEPQVLLLDDAEAVWVRQDPPYGMGYLTTTWLLEQTRALVVNDPAALRDLPEKLSIFRFPDLIPPSMVALDAPSLKAFHARHGAIVVKPLYGNGGFGIVRLGPDDRNLDSLLELFDALDGLPVFAQAFLEDVYTGDRRVLLVDGQAIGAINRVPPDGAFRANMHVGGRAEATDLTARDHEITAAIGPFLRERGVLFAGIDIIGGRLTEINITSPTGLVELRRFSGVNGASLVMDALEARLSARNDRPATPVPSS